jgi:sodium/proline symporter
LDTVNIVVFVAYLITLVGIGYATFLRAKTYSDHTIAGRSSNKWVTAISAESSDMSGWLLLGLPGMAYATGYGSVWTLLGLLAGTLFNWVVIANRLRTITEHYDAITLIDYLEKRVDDSKGTLGIIAGIVIILFMIINSSAEVIGSGKLLNAAFGFDYNVGIFSWRWYSSSVYFFGRVFSRYLEQFNPGFDNVFCAGVCAHSRYFQCRRH